MKHQVNIDGLEIRSVNEHTIAEMCCEDLSISLRERAQIFLNDYKGSLDRANESRLRAIEREIESINFNRLVELGLKIYNRVSETGVSSSQIRSIDTLYKMTVYNVKNNIPFKITVMPLTEKDKQFNTSYLWQEYKNGNLTSKEITQKLRGIKWPYKTLTIQF